MGWILVPCLQGLRSEFDHVAPRRDRGADGSIGDSNHNSSSDHSPDEDSAILRDHDADDKNEVHALAIDSSGPWPDGRGNEAGGWFDLAIKRIVERHRLGIDDRLQYVIWRGHIASRSWGWTWRVYTSTSDPHTNHAHFSSRYTTAQEQDVSPWGLLDQEGSDMPLADDQITLTADTAKEIGRKAGDKVTAATLLQLAVIFAARGDDKAGAANDRYESIDTRLGAVEQWIRAFSSPGTPPAQVAAALKAALGDRAAEVGRLLAGQA